ncbi:hypothetical protein LCGC14_1923160 [marine sediment metagenome]|uniref:Uncharacterized protein n=1 Tax=marine sediment metagenome TaxID=412755 RepID=A0A0F9I433_9ZZZZ
MKCSKCGKSLTLEQKTEVICETFPTLEWKYDRIHDSWYGVLKERTWIETRANPYSKKIAKCKKGPSLEEELVLLREEVEGLKVELGKKMYQKETEKILEEWRVWSSGAFVDCRGWYDGPNGSVAIIYSNMHT